MPQLRTISLHVIFLTLSTVTSAINLKLINDASYPTSTKQDSAVISAVRPAIQMYYGDGFASSVLLGLSGREADLWAMESGCSECYAALNVPNTSTSALPAFIASTTAYQSVSGSSGFRGTVSLRIDSDVLDDASVGVMNEIVSTATDVVEVQGTQGIFGLGFSGLSQLNSTGILSQFVQLTNSPTAALAFAPDNAFLDFGEPDSSKFSGSIQWVPTVSSTQKWQDSQMGLWMFQVSGMCFDDAQFSIGSVGSPLVAAIDPSSPFVFVPEQLAVALYNAAGFNYSRPTGPRTTDPGFFYVPCSQPTAHVFKIVISNLKYSFAYQALPLSYGTKDDQVFNQNGVCIGNLASTNYNPYGVSNTLDNPSMVLGMPFLQTVVTVLRYETDDCLPPSLGFAPVMTSSNLTIGRAADTTGKFATNTVTSLPSSLCTPLKLDIKQGSSNGPNVGLIAGVTAAAVLLVIAVGGIFWYMRMHKKHTQGYMANKKGSDELPVGTIGSNRNMSRSPALTAAGGVPSRAQSPLDGWANEKASYRYSPNDKAALLELQSRMDDKTKLQTILPPRHSEVSAASSFGSPSQMAPSSAMRTNTDADGDLRFTPSIFAQTGRDDQSVAGSTTMGRNSAMTSRSYYANHRSLAPTVDDEALRPETYYDPYNSGGSTSNNGISRQNTYTSARSGLTGISMDLSEAPPLPSHGGSRNAARGQTYSMATMTTVSDDRPTTVIQPSPALESARLTAPEDDDDDDDRTPDYLFKTSFNPSFDGASAYTQRPNRDSDWI